jgi:uncharacterized protein YndB with AHSA1/START domain
MEAKTSKAKELKIEANGDREVVITRKFNAPRELVFRAHTEPELVRRWMLGPDGWTMPVCEIDLRPGGKYRFVWHKEKTGESMGMGGRYSEVERPTMYAATEKFDDPWYEGEANSRTTFTENEAVTELKNVMQYVSKAARDQVLASPMESGMIETYNRLDDVLKNLE